MNLANYQSIYTMPITYEILSVGLHSFRELETYQLKIYNVCMTQYSPNAPWHFNLVI